jgi:hypothetical protein
VTASSVARIGSAVTISLNGIGVRYEGKISADLNSIDGTFLQAVYPLALVLTRVKDQAKQGRPGFHAEIVIRLSLPTDRQRRLNTRSTCACTPCFFNHCQRGAG